MTNAKILLEKLRKDSEMTDREYDNFCKRYAKRNISTVIWYLNQSYGELPQGIDKEIRSELLSLKK